VSDSGAAEIRPFEPLHLAAVRAGAVVCLTSTADRRAQDGRKPYTRREGSRLRMLVVVQPLREGDHDRFQRLAHGVTLCQCEVDDQAPLEGAALVLVERLTAHARRAA